MKIASILALAGCLLLGPSCSSEAGASSGLADIANRLTTTLTSITDGPTAEKAKDEVASLTDQLGSALSSLKDSATDAAKPAGEQVGKLIEAGKSGLSDVVNSALAKVKDQIARLTANADIQKVIGPTLDKLKGLIGM